MGKSTISMAIFNSYVSSPEGKSHNKSHEKPPFSYGFPMVFLWFSYGFPMVFLWFSYGFPMLNHQPSPGAVLDERRQHSHRASPHRAPLRGESINAAIVFSGTVEGNENHGNAMGKAWENHRKMVVFHGISWDLPSGKLT